MVFKAHLSYKYRLRCACISLLNITLMKGVFILHITTLLNNPTKFKPLVITTICSIWGILQIYNVYTNILDPFRLNVTHVVFALVLTFLIYPLYNHSDKSDQRNFYILSPVINFVLICLTISAWAYSFFSYDSIQFR